MKKRLVQHYSAFSPFTCCTRPEGVTHTHTHTHAQTNTYTVITEVIKPHLSPRMKTQPEVIISELCNVCEISLNGGMKHVNRAFEVLSITNQTDVFWNYVIDH